MSNLNLEDLEKKTLKTSNQVNARTKGKGIWKEPIADNNSIMER